jgi:hypothetical protein
VLNYDPVMTRSDMKLRFPAGYVEPEHKNIWKPKNAVGKNGVARYTGKRKAGQV